MKQSPFWESDIRSASQEITRLIWNQKVHSCSQGPATSPYPEPDKSSPTPQPISLRSIVTFYAIYACVSDLSLPTTKKSVRISHHSYAYYIPRPFHSPEFDDPNNIWFRSQWPEVLDRLDTGIVCSNPARGMDICPRPSVLSCPV
jgi:hypothetical protein